MNGVHDVRAREHYKVGRLYGFRNPRAPLIVASGHVTKNNYLYEGLKMITVVHFNLVVGRIFLNRQIKAVLETTIRNWPAIFTNGIFYCLSHCCPIRYGKFGRLNDEIGWKMAGGGL